jgi:hypothetical protein
MGFAIARDKGADIRDRGLWPGVNVHRLNPPYAGYLPTISAARATNAGEAA